MAHLKGGQDDLDLLRRSLPAAALLGLLRALLLRLALDAQAELLVHGIDLVQRVDRDARTAEVAFVKPARSGKEQKKGGSGRQGGISCGV